jgi:hypothetical protein
MLLSSKSMSDFKGPKVAALTIKNKKSVGFGLVRGIR